MLLDSSGQHTPGQRSSYISALRTTLRPPRSPVLTSPPGLGPPVLSTNHSSTHTSAASGVRQDGRVYRDHSALAQLCGFVPPKLSKICTHCVKESARDSELLFNVIAHLGYPGAREIVQLFAVTSVSSGNPGAMEPTLSSSLLFNMIVHLVNTGAREIVKSLVVNSVSSGNPDAIEPSLSSSLAEQTPSHQLHLSPLKSNTGSSHLQATSHHKATLHPRSNTWSSHLQAASHHRRSPTKITGSSRLQAASHRRSNTWSSHLQVASHHRRSPTKITGSSRLQAASHRRSNTWSSHLQAASHHRRSYTKLQSPGRHVFRRPHTIGKK